MALLGGAVGLLAGISSGGGAASVISMTTGIVSPLRRLLARFALGLVFGIIPGLIFVAGAQMETLPVRGFLYGLGLGTLMTSGIAVGLEFAERLLGRSSPTGMAAPADRVETLALQRKGG